ncbi:hypothetical protein CVT26_004310 [Gymnopilus dilepis]|uniref:Major facilitator superfamily (MFS) profile domain-containing protein n=1 Tax=Gymnopilus dilepis TaxID=231916 RepID=A0A409WPV4_9AGAR|nr:hypothetical protein CVT26_004310 [Gymnopilus dilepis]
MASSASGVLPSTIVDYAQYRHESTSGASASTSGLSRVVSSSQNILTRRVDSPQHLPQEPEENAELKLPSWRSMGIVIGGNALFQIAFFIIVSSASVYAELLGGTPTFSGLTIGIPPAISGIFLIFITRYDRGQYGRPLLISITAFILGNTIYALAYPLHLLPLLLLGRIVSGFGFISFMYSKRFCADPRIVGVRRRTTLAGYLVLGQAVGFSAGPFLGGVLYKVGFEDRVFNGVTAPGWLMAGVFVIFGVVSWFVFEDVPARPSRGASTALSPLSTTTTITQATPQEPETESQSPQADPTYPTSTSLLSLTRSQTLVTICMCYYSLMCFFILGAWEANIPIYTALPSVLSYTPFSAGNFIALGGLVSFPLLLLLTTLLSGRLSDRFILGLGTSLGLTGLLLTLAVLLADKVRFASLFVSWALIAFGFNLASTCCLSLLSKQLPETYTRSASMAIQYSNYAGRVSGAILGGSGVKIGMVRYVGVQLGVVGLGALRFQAPEHHIHKNIKPQSPSPEVKPPPSPRLPNTPLLPPHAMAHPMNLPSAPHAQVPPHTLNTSGHSYDRQTLISSGVKLLDAVYAQITSPTLDWGQFGHMKEIVLKLYNSASNVRALITSSDPEIQSWYEPHEVEQFYEGAQVCYETLQIVVQAAKAKNTEAAPSLKVASEEVIEPPNYGAFFKRLVVPKGEAAL